MYDEVADWLNNVLIQDIPEEVVAFCFKLYENGKSVMLPSVTLFFIYLSRSFLFSSFPNGIILSVPLDGADGGGALGDDEVGGGVIFVVKATNSHTAEAFAVVAFEGNGIFPFVGRDGGNAGRNVKLIVMRHLNG